MRPLASLPWSGLNLLPPLVDDYIAGKESISFLTKYPFALSAFEKVIADKAKDNTDRKLLVDVLHRQYADIPTTEAVANNIHALLSEKTFTVTAAHQPCLFMGPLYNIYKISCSINLAQQLKKQFPAYHFVPVFWLGSEDHDTEELNHAYVNGKKIEWKGAGQGAAGRWPTATMQQAVDELKAMSGNPDIISMLEAGLKQYATFGKLTQYFVNEIFKEHGLVVLDQDDAQLKKKFSTVIKDEVLNSRAVEVLKDNIDFLEKNYKAQAKPRGINFFYLQENARERIVLDAASKKYLVNNTNVSFTSEEIIAEIDSHPGRFSPNVIYRPLYQEMILPNLAFIGGAGELSYWLELKPLFDYHKVNYPMQVLRTSAVIISAAVQKKIEKLNLKPEDFFGDVEQLINRYVKESISGDSDFIKEKEKLEELYNSVLLKAERADATLKNNAAAEKQKALAGLDSLEGKMLKAEKRKHETAVNQIRSIHVVFFPEGVLQERREGFISYYNPDFIFELITQFDAFSKTLKVLVES
jgi:bacillithiol biosynthesis cysteine-adding enzyme BshC